MSYRPPPTEFTKRILFERIPEITVNATDIFASFINIASWEIVRDGRTPVPIWGIMLSQMAASMIRDAGTNQISVELDADTDTTGGSSFINGHNSIDAAFTAKMGFVDNYVESQVNRNFLNLVAYNGDGATSGRIKDLQLYYEILLPIGASLKRVI